MDMLADTTPVLLASILGSLYVKKVDRYVKKVDRVAGPRSPVVTKRCIEAYLKELDSDVNVSWFRAADKSCGVLLPTARHYRKVGAEAEFTKDADTAWDKVRAHDTVNTQPTALTLAIYPTHSQFLPRLKPPMNGLPQRVNLSTSKGSAEDKKHAYHVARATTML